MNVGQWLLMIASAFAFVAFCAAVEFLAPREAIVPAMALSGAFGWLGSALK